MISDKKIFFSFLLLAVFLFTMLFFTHDNKKMEVILGGKVFRMDIADSYAVQERGLSGHKPLLDDQGMIFIFPRSDIYYFWMKGMLYPLDIIWVDQNFKIIHIEKSLSSDTYPKTFGPSSPSLYVLEISAGESLKLGLKIGDSVEFVEK